MGVMKDGKKLGVSDAEWWVWRDAEGDVEHMAEMLAYQDRIDGKWRSLDIYREQAEVVKRLIDEV